MIPFYLITGFLGSGKTTFLKEILNELGSKQKVVVIQNEFAHNGIDGKTLKQTSPDFKLVEMNNGSVFCVCLLSNFVDTLVKITEEYNPDIIFLEASGLADPINVAELLQSERLNGKLQLQHVYAVVDALNFDKSYQMMVRFKHQIMIADSVIINKADLNQKGLQHIGQKVSELAPFANQIKTRFCKDVFQLQPLEEKAHPRNAFNEIAPEGKPEGISTCVLRTTETISIMGLKAFIQKMIPQCFRLKGFANLDTGEVIAVQATFEQTEFQKVENYTGPSELIAFSTVLDSTQFRKTYFEMLNVDPTT